MYRLWNVLSHEHTWVTPHPWCTACKVSSLNGIGAPTPRHAANKVTSLWYGWAHIHTNVQPVTVQHCCLSAYWCIDKKHISGGHVWWCFIDKVVKFHGGRLKIEWVTTMHVSVWVIFLKLFYPQRSRNYSQLDSYWCWECITDIPRIHGYIKAITIWQHSSVK